MSHERKAHARDDYLTATRKRKHVAIIGFGYVGTVLGVYLAERGFHVTGIDSQPSVIRKIASGEPHLKEPQVSESLSKLISSGALSVTSSYEAISDSGILIVTVGTPIGGQYSPDLTALESCINEIGKFLRKGQLLIAKSTLPPGTTRTVVAAMLQEFGFEPGKDIFLSFCPERLAEGNAMNEIKELPVVVGGINEESAVLAEEFWRSAGLNVIRVSSLEAAELVKLTDNVWIDVNVALANELARVCEAIEVNAMEVIAAANSLPKGRGKVNCLTPGIGVGGSCLTKDPWFLVNFAASKGVEIEIPQIARQVNERVPTVILETLLSILRGRGFTPNRTKVAILGYAFKGSTSDTRNTPANPIIRGLIHRGFKVSVFDPWVDPKTIEEECGIKESDSLGSCIDGAQAVVLVANHPEFKWDDISPKLEREAIVFDGWHSFDPLSVAKGGHDYYSPGNFVRSRH